MVVKKLVSAGCLLRSLLIVSVPPAALRAYYHFLSNDFHCYILLRLLLRGSCNFCTSCKGVAFLVSS